jgi:hypothetical protein
MDVSRDWSVVEAIATSGADGRVLPEMTNRPASTTLAHASQLAGAHGGSMNARVSARKRSPRRDTFVATTTIGAIVEALVCCLR